MQDLKDLYIEESMGEIKLMSKNKFLKLLRERSKLRALNYLIGKQILKGKVIKYEHLEMSEYLLPSTPALTIKE